MESNNLNEYKNWLEKRNLSPQTIRTRIWEMREYGFQRELSVDGIIGFLKENLKRYQPNSLKSICGTLSSYSKFKKVEIEWELITRLIPKVQRKFFVTIDEKDLENLT